jgi:hypothetical protein
LLPLLAFNFNVIAYFLLIVNCSLGESKKHQILAFTQFIALLSLFGQLWQEYNT